MWWNSCYYMYWRIRRSPEYFRGGSQLLLSLWSSCTATICCKSYAVCSLQSKNQVLQDSVWVMMGSGVINFKRPEDNQIPSLWPTPKAFVELAMENESFPVQDRDASSLTTSTFPTWQVLGWSNQPIDQSVGSFSKPQGKTRSDCPSGGGNPVGQPLVYVDTGEFPC